jgi:hypothetical protein
MTTAEKGFLLAYTGAPLSKTATEVLHIPPGLFGFDSREEANRRDTEDSVLARGAAGGVAGLVAGGGLSALWGKLHDKPSVARDFVVGLTAAAAGTAAGAYSGIKKGERVGRGIQRARGITHGVVDLINRASEYPRLNLSKKPAPLPMVRVLGLGLGVEN